MYDGGGILPDVTLESAEFSPITTALLKDNAIFDYATEYYYTHELSDWKGFEINEAEFNKFLNYLEKTNFTYETETEKKFAEALRRADDDELQLSIQDSYDNLMNSIAKAKKENLVDKKIEIQSLLTNEILKRYFYAEGLYDYQVQHNPEILEAIAVLKDEKRYNGILK